MKIFKKMLFKGLPLGLLLLGIVGCNSILKAMKFQNSAYGVEMQNMINVCMQNQKNGQLSGIRSGKDMSMEFFSDEVDFSSRDNTRFPMKLNCTVVQNNKEHSFPYVKESKGGKWRLNRI